MDISAALVALAPEAEWSMNAEDYDQLEWFSADIPKPTLAEVNAKVAELQAAEPMKLLRIERDRLIAETDWWVLPDRTPTDEQLAYRQALRDLPANTEDPLNPTWPIRPS